jgi:AcrR family transcriptional regulator
MTTETTTPVRRRGGPSKGDQREAQILEATRGLLVDRTVNDLTVDAIAKAAGVTRTAFYFYFPTKHAVVAAMLDGLWEEFGATHAWLESTGPDVAGLREHHRQTVAVWREHREILTCTMGPVGYEPLEEWVEKARMRYDDALEAKIRRDRDAGLAPGGIDAGALAEMVADLRTSRFRAMARLKSSTLEKALDELTEVVLRMIYGSAPTA